MNTSLINLITWLLASFAVALAVGKFRYEFLSLEALAAGVTAVAIVLVLGAGLGLQLSNRPHTAAVLDVAFNSTTITVILLALAYWAFVPVR
jgi:hypothetical protein